MKLILDFISDPKADENWGWILVAILLAVLVVRTVFFTVNSTLGILTGKFKKFENFCTTILEKLFALNTKTPSKIMN